MKTKAEQLYEARLLALPPERRLAMAGEMLAAARELVIAGMQKDEAADPRQVRRHLFLSFYGEDVKHALKERILADV